MLTHCPIIHASPKPQLDCVSCHQVQVSAWRKSDHAKAMSMANEKNVLGDFTDAILEHYTQKARFFKDKNAYWIELTHAQNTVKYQIHHTFGHYPLQQYLVKTDSGRYQVLPYAWDSRSAEQGGQKWYAIYADEDILENDRLHWQQPLQNWNGMCADCHSDGLKRHYSASQNAFNTRWDNINVGCQSCHGEMTEHANSSVDFSHTPSNKTKLANWVRDLEDDVAQWQGSDNEQEQLNKTMDNCFACHSLRSPLIDGFQANIAFLDQFSPSFIQPPLYHADGQIKEEVYVYGSFLQSKMHATGVTCMDCHDSHSMQVKADNNGLCLQCHSPAKFNIKQHHGHEQSSEGSQCVNCHMPTNTYMGVDDRRDHSFKIPRPDLSGLFNTPNACVQCHDNKDNQWAANNLKKWHGKPKVIGKNYMAFMQLQSGQAIDIQLHLAIIEDTTLTEIVRASALAMLANSNTQLNDNIVKKWVTSELPLIRLAAAQVGNLLPPIDRQKSYASLLKDKYRAIRVAAANRLLDNKGRLSAYTKQAFAELITANDVTSWRGEGRLNQGITYLKNKDVEKALSTLTQAIEIDPYFAPSYINLADIYRNLNDSKNEKRILDLGLAATPNSGLLHYSHGMYLVRNKQYEVAIQSFEQALKIEPENPQFAYIYLVALDSTGKTALAISQLKRMMEYFSKNQQLMQLGMGLAQKVADRRSFDYFRQTVK